MLVVMKWAILVCLFTSCLAESIVDDIPLADGSLANSPDEPSKLYTHDDILAEIAKLTNDFLEEVINLHNLVPKAPLFDLSDQSGNETDPENDAIDPARRRRKRSPSMESVPEFIRDGIKLISEIRPTEGRLCAQHGFIIDFTLAKFANQQYLLCLVKSAQSGSYQLHYGAVPFTDHSWPLPALSHPTKVLTFRSLKSGHEQLVVVILNSKHVLNEPSVLWASINANNKLTYANDLKDLSRISSNNGAVWPRTNMMVLNDAYERTLKVYKFEGTYFDLQASLDVSDGELSALRSFTFNGIPYLAFAYKHSTGMDSSRQWSLLRDITVLRYNEFTNSFEKVQSIQITDQVTGIEFLSLGFGTNQESFLIITERGWLVFYKFLKSKREFIIFQRLPVEGVRHVVAYGDSQRSLVIAVVLHSNDVYLITYNSLRFIFSNVNIRLFVSPAQPIHLYRLTSPHTGHNQVQLMIGALDGIRVHNISFYHDDNLMRLWTEHLKWCQAKRLELAHLERVSNTVTTRFSESYYKNDPIRLTGSLVVPAYRGTAPVVASEYRQMAGPHARVALNHHYFTQLVHMERELDRINVDLDRASTRLSHDAFLINTNQVQRVTGNYSFDDLRVMRYQSSGADVPATFNLITSNLNGHSVRNLFAETVSIDKGSDVKLLEPMAFEKIEIGDPSPSSTGSLRVNGLVQNKYNLSQLVTTTGSVYIGGRKRLHTPLLVEHRMDVQRVNGRKFESGSILLTRGDQFIKNAVVFHSPRLHANTLNVKMVNDVDMDVLISGSVKKSEQVRLSMPLEFSQGLSVYNVGLDGGATLNGHSLDSLVHDVLWLNGRNQTLNSDYVFQQDVSIDGPLQVKQINNKNIPADLILPNRKGTINIVQGGVAFIDRVQVHNANISTQMNGVHIYQGMPDLLLKHHAQTITGRKSFSSLSIDGHSHVQGTINGLDIVELDRLSRNRPAVQHLDKLIVDSLASFDGGLWVHGQLNALTKLQLDRLMLGALHTGQAWNGLAFDHVHFDHVRVEGIFDCALVNGLDLERDLLTRNTNQTIMAPYSFGTVLLEGKAAVKTMNGFEMSRLDNVLLKTGPQRVPGPKIIVGDVFVSSLGLLNRINSIPLDDLVFISNTAPRKLITGLKTFNLNGSLGFDHLTVGHDLIVSSLNGVSLAHLLSTSLKLRAPQTIPNAFQVATLIVPKGQNLVAHSLNGVDLRALAADAVYGRQAGFQNVTAHKLFTGNVTFGQVHFERLFDGVTSWEMKHNWMINGLSQNVYSNFSVDSLTVAGGVFVHNSQLTGVPLEWLQENVVRVNSKSVVHGPLQFHGKTYIESGNVQLHGLLNDIDTRKHILLNSRTDQVQTVHGKLTLLGNLTLATDLDINGRINGLRLEEMCSRAYRPSSGHSRLSVAGNVVIEHPAQVVNINSFTMDQLEQYALRHDVRTTQVISGKKLIDQLTTLGPVSLTKTVNNFNMQQLWRSYMSLSKDQLILAPITLHSDQFVAGPLHVQREMTVETGIVAGVNLQQIDSTVLRIFGDQQYDGNLAFAQGLNLNLHLNAKWANGGDLGALMNKRKKLHVFTGQSVEFTQSVHVTGSANLVKGRRLGAVIVDRMFSDAITRNGKNYTVYGTKTLDALRAYHVHTRPLNRVTVSRENLLLKDYDQKVTGPLVVDNSVVVNHSLVVNTIDNIHISRLHSDMVKQSQANTIHSPIVIRQLQVRNAVANALIDNVNITVLNTISDRVNLMRDLEASALATKRMYELFQSKLASLQPDLLQYDMVNSVDGQKLGLDHVDRPLLMVARVDGSMLLGLQVNQGTQQHPACNQFNLYTTSAATRMDRWTLLQTVVMPGPIVSAHYNNHGHLVLAAQPLAQLDQAFKCLLQNVPSFTTAMQTLKLSAGNVVFFSFQVSASGLQLIESTLFLRNIAGAHVNWLERGNASLALITSNREVHPFCVGASRACLLNGAVTPIALDGLVKKVHTHQTWVAVTVFKEHGHKYELNLFRLSTGQLIKHQTLVLLNPVNTLFVHRSATDHPTNEQVLFFVAEARSPAARYEPRVHVFSSIGASQFVQVQEIVTPSLVTVQSLHALPGPRNTPLRILFRSSEQVAVYQQAGPSGRFVRTIHFPVGESMKHLTVVPVSGTSVPPMVHYLALYYSSHCEQSPYKVDQRHNHVDILRARFSLEQWASSYYSGQVTSSDQQHLYVRDGLATGNDTSLPIS